MKKITNEYLIVLRVKTGKPMPMIADLAAGRVQTMDGVERPVEVVSFVDVFDHGTIQIEFVNTPKDGG